jgi:hypothetical protein
MNALEHEKFQSFRSGGNLCGIMRITAVRCCSLRKSSLLPRVDVHFWLDPKMHQKNQGCEEDGLTPSFESLKFLKLTRVQT